MSAVRAWFRPRPVVHAALACGVLLLINEFVYPVLWWSLPISGTIVDARTQVPVAGAVVNATWDLAGATPSGPGALGPLRVMETETDAEGRFRIHGWLGFHPGWGRVLSDSPRVWVLRYDYAPLKLEYTRQLNSIISVSLPTRITLTSSYADMDDTRSKLIAWYQEQVRALSSRRCSWADMPLSNREWMLSAQQSQLHQEVFGIVFEPTQPWSTCDH